MPIPPAADDASQTSKEVRDRLEMERKWQLRQENVLPLETAWNEGRFYGLALKGTIRLTGVQRVGIFLVGSLALGSALMTMKIAGFRDVGPSLRTISQLLPDVPLVFVPIILLELALGLLLCWVAIKRFPPNQNHHHRSRQQST